MKHPALRFLLTVIIAVGALYFAFRKTDFVQLLDEVRHANVEWILIGVVLLFMSHLVRAWRWKIIMRPMKPGMSLFVCYKALLGGYGVNNIVPRSGELMRPFILAKHEKVFLSGTIGTIMVERVTDLISMILFLMSALFLFPRELEKAFPSIANATFPLFAGMAALLTLVIIMVFSEAKTLKVIYSLTKRWPVKIRSVVDKMASEFSIGLKGVRAGGSVAIILGTVGIWVFYVLSMFAALYAFHEPAFMAVGLVGAFFLRVLSGLAFMIPTPGGTGSYHFFISQALVQIFGVPLAAGIAYATLTHAANYILTTLIGIIIVLAEGISLKDFSSALKAHEHGHEHDSSLEASKVEHLAKG